MTDDSKTNCNSGFRLVQIISHDKADMFQIKQKLKQKSCFFLVCGMEGGGGVLVESWLIFLIELR